MYLCATKNLKKMKKVILTLAAVLCCASLFVSCKKGDNPDTPDTTPAFVEMTFSFYATQDMINYTDMLVSYEAGNEKNSVNQENLEWSKTVKVNLPCTIKFGRTITVKDGAQLTPDKNFAYTTGFGVSYNFLNAAGQQVKRGGIASSSVSSSMKADKVAVLINNGTLNSEFVYTFDKDGNVAE